MNDCKTDTLSDFTSPVIVSPEQVQRLQNFILSALENLAPESCNFAAMDADGRIWAMYDAPKLLNPDDYHAEWPISYGFHIATVQTMTSLELGDVYRVAYAQRPTDNAIDF